MASKASLLHILHSSHISYTPPHISFSCPFLPPPPLPSTPSSPSSSGLPLPLTSLSPPSLVPSSPPPHRLPIPSSPSSSGLPLLSPTSPTSPPLPALPLPSPPYPSPPLPAPPLLDGGSRRSNDRRILRLHHWTYGPRLHGRCQRSCGLCTRNGKCLV